MKIAFQSRDRSLLIVLDQHKLRRKKEKSRAEHFKYLLSFSLIFDELRRNDFVFCIFYSSLRSRLIVVCVDICWMRFLAKQEWLDAGSFDIIQVFFTIVLLFIHRRSFFGKKNCLFAENTAGSRAPKPKSVLVPIRS